MLYPTQTVKDLGVAVSADLSWTPHVHMIAERAGNVASGGRASGGRGMNARMLYLLGISPQINPNNSLLVIQIICLISGCITHKCVTHNYVLDQALLHI